MKLETTKRVAAGTIEAIRLPGLTPYADAYRMQLERRDAIQSATANEAVFLLEHTPVFTLGRNAQVEHLLRSAEELARVDIDVVETDRGGDITYHGPGQLVAYPILRIEERGLAIRAYLRLLEHVIIDLLGGYGLNGERMQGFTGVWVNGAKVAAIGVGVHKGVSFHGIAINIAPNLDHFGWIVPCGIPDKPVGTLQSLLETPPTMDELAASFHHHLLDALPRSPQEIG